MKHYQYILLDWDGNLANTLQVWVDVARHVLDSRGYNLSESQVGAMLGQFEPEFARLGLPEPRLAMEEIMKLGSDRLGDVELYPDALEVLTAIHQRGKKLALVTTSSRVAVMPVLKKYGLDAMFEAIIGGEDVDHHKPHSEPLEKALAALHGTKEQAIMIGDTEKDVGAANNFGIDSILFMPAQHAAFYDFEAMLAHNPTHTVTDFREILTIIK